MMRRIIPAVAAAALAACTPMAAEEPGPAMPSDTAQAGAQCDAGVVQDLIGRNADAVQAEAQRRSGARTVRRYTTGSAVTMDFRPDRLNVETDATGAIVKLGCG